MWQMTEHQACERVRSLVRQLKEEYNLSSNLHYQGIDDPVAKRLQVKIKHGNLPQKLGIYLPYTQEGPTIILDAHKQGPERLNFTYFHELTHHLIRQDNNLYSWIVESQQIDRLLERLCDVGAGEFLLPISEMQYLIREKGFSIQLIPHIDELYFASKPSILVQLLECANHECYGVICSHGTTPELPMLPSVESQTPIMQVEFSIASVSARYSIGRNTTIETAHPISEAFLLQAAISGKGRIPFKSRTDWKVDCEALFYKGKVYAIFNATTPNQFNPDQLSFC